MRHCPLRPLIAFSLMLLSLAGQAQVIVQPRAPGIESPDYVWNEIKDEALLALRASGDRQRGEQAYRVCHGCHKAGALGTPDGVYPRLAGQLDTVLIKQLVDVRTGRRDNPTMYPFASEHGITTQEIADLGAYLTALPAPPDNGKGDGRQLPRGEGLYNRDCSQCHGKNGEGNDRKFHPRVAGQHFEYLARQVREIRSGHRRNANPKMVAIVKAYNEKDILAVADHMSRLPRSAASR